MRRYISYLNYVLRHKWFVFIAGLKIGAPLWRLLVHDLSKLRPSEFIEYARTYYKADGGKQFSPTPGFDKAWLLHVRRNPHHWEAWVMPTAKGPEPTEMPRQYLLEMVADWMGAGRAIRGTWEYAKWYRGQRDRIVLADDTREIVESILLHQPPYV